MTSDTPQISEREREILRLVATGATNQQIAQTLNISINTVKVHLRNIFAKIGAASRTEATVYAMRMGLVEIPPGQATPEPAEAALEPKTDPEPEPDSPPEAIVPEPAVLMPQDPALVVPTPAPQRRWLIPALSLVGLIAIIATVAHFLPTNTPPAPIPTAAVEGGSDVSESWSALMPMPQGHAAFGMTTYESNGKQYLYAISGIVGDKIDGAVLRYDIQTNTWSGLPPKPTAVSNIHAAVLGKRIYVPGGQLASGQPSDILEAYDQQSNRWVGLRNMPAPRSGYALIAFEGKLYLFGGWDGARYCDEVFSYTPDTDSWQQLTAMPTARAFADAVLVGQDIYVVGGENDQGKLTANERYTPADDPASKPWASLVPMPVAASHVATGSAISNDRQIYLFSADLNTQHLIYNVSHDTWQRMAIPAVLPADLRINIVNNKIYLLGGQIDGKAQTTVSMYQPVFVIMLPQINLPNSE